jgi:hypothetical protein
MPAHRWAGYRYNLTRGALLHSLTCHTHGVTCTLVRTSLPCCVFLKICASFRFRILLTIPWDLFLN